ncbi:glycosyltransferase family 2 protein [Salegentibacter maritimus]|uniref:Glycosyltransferase family 2 protein n=1 Tax=Salegentibacter maritimus TaxID=2794347 RepID=A0ABS0TBY7_9FLAO|nr:glycosyltransferase family 2 protein [Salegentibacter maritimus]MBI6118550.1 glycosyltransferase family 2 protein [Salegentibacter maritimus]
MKPLVSIIIPTYNRVHLIGETLESVLSQTYQNWECMVVDDGSTDYTDELMEFYCNKDNRIKYHHRPANRPKGANACRNYGFELSKGEFIQFLDSDDLISKEKLYGQLEIFKSDADVELSFCAWYYFRLNSTDYRDYGVFKSLHKCTTPKKLFDFLGNKSTFLVPHVYLTKRSLLQRSGLWNEYLTINQDGEFFSRVLCFATKIKFSDKSKAFYRQNLGVETLSTLNSDKKIKDAIRSWRLIEKYHNMRYANGTMPYIRNGKEALFQSLLKIKTEEIDLNKDFFAYEIRQNKFKSKAVKKINELRNCFGNFVKKINVLNIFDKR